MHGWDVTFVGILGQVEDVKGVIEFDRSCIVSCIIDQCCLRKFLTLSDRK